jgi:hypothetical protein
MISLLSADFSERSNVSFGYVYYTYVEGFSRQEMPGIGMGAAEYPGMVFIDRVGAR